MDREFGAQIDLKKSSTLSVPGSIYPLVIIKKLNFDHSIFENPNREKQIKFQDKTSSLQSPKKKQNYSTNNNTNNSNLINIKNKDNSLLKSIRINKFKNDKSEMGNSCKDFYTNKNSSTKNIISPLKQEKSGMITLEKKFDKIEKKNKLERPEKPAESPNIRGESRKSEKVHKHEERSALSVNLKTISEKVKKKKENNNKKNSQVILPKILISPEPNNKKFISAKNNMDEEKKSLVNNNISHVRNKTTESLYRAEKRRDNPTFSSAENNNYLSNSNNINPSNRYTSVMKTFRDKKLHIFDKNKFFYYIITPGNSSYLIKNCMQHRTNWKECSSSTTTLFNFKWQQNNIGIDFASLSKISTIKQIVNHFEFHSQISNKCNLLINMMKFCESRNLEVFKYLPFTVLIQYDSHNYQSQMENFSNFYNSIKDYISESSALDKGRKDSLFPTGKEQKFNKKYSSFFSIPGAGNEKLGIKTSMFIDPHLYDNKNFWIVKASDLNRGRCIKLAESLGKIQKLIKKFYEGIYRDFANDNDDIEYEPFKSNNILSDEEKKKIMNKKYRSNFVIIQKYLEKPLLYRGRKFDMRIWVLITHKLQVYIFKEGHLKTSSVAYDINAKDSYVHITNYSIQKYNDNFSKYEYGNEVSFKDFQIFLNEAYPEDNYDVKDFVKKMQEIIEISMKSVKTKLNPSERSYSFEIFGYDFIMDSDFNLYLLEINTNPGLEESSPLIKVLVPRMLDDALRLTIDEINETKYSFSPCIEENSTNINNEDNKNLYISPFFVEGYSNTENLWEIVCDLNEKEKYERYENVEKNERSRKKTKGKN